MIFTHPFRKLCYFQMFLYELYYNDTEMLPVIIEQEVWHAFLK